ncbi:LOW QUALITY PROTEIN: uncharacterized protein [Phyllobates terribilis]|uniref:LOW QUALITY PROTEIN: uncharacterized protein n=1 Tax=Phyllobates terribilis TaxID=111132 RepID=UPI003CCADEF2
MATLELWDSVIMKRINIQQFRLDLNLNVVLNEKIGLLLERDHSTSLAGAINDLESSTICLPITVVCYQFSYRRHAGNHNTCLSSPAIGAIFAATDSVCTLQVLNQDETPLLYSLVFGEGVVNDATSVVLFNAIQNFDFSNISAKITRMFIGNFLELFFASTSLGVMTGLLSAYIIKKLYIGRHSTDREVALVILMAYFSYMLAELFYLSGILNCSFCGVVMSHYTWHNVTESSRITTKHAFATLSFVAETFIFLYVGMDALDMDKWRFVHDILEQLIVVSSILLFLVMVGRAALVFPLSFVSNFDQKAGSKKISIRQQVIIWWASLMRGAVSMALAHSRNWMWSIMALICNQEDISPIVTRSLSAKFPKIKGRALNQLHITFFEAHPEAVQKEMEACYLWIFNILHVRER